MKDMVLLSLVRTWDTLSVGMLAMHLVSCWDEKNLANQNLLTTLSAYTPSFYTRTYLSTISLMTRQPHWCVVCFLSQNLTLETVQLLDNTWTIRHLATCNSNQCSKNFFIVFALTWETRALQKHRLYLSVSLVLFWCLEKGSINQF